jgi:threonine/homoserine/homoserine lactone efflux protein
VLVPAMLNSLLNPKALLFFMVFLPQFVNPAGAPVAQQIVTLGVVLTAIAVVFHAVLGVLGGAIHRFLSRNKGAARLQSYGLASVLVLLALRLAVTSRPD